MEFSILHSLPLASWSVWKPCREPALIKELLRFLPPIIVPLDSIVSIPAIHLDNSGWIGQGFAFLHFVVHLSTHASHGNNLDAPHSPPTSPSAGSARIAGSTSTLAALLRSRRIRSTTPNGCTAQANTTSQQTALTREHAEESDTRVDPVLGRIVAQVAVLLHHSSIDVEGATNTPNSRQTPNFQAQKGVRALAKAKRKSQFPIICIGLPTLVALDLPCLHRRSPTQ